MKKKRLSLICAVLLGIMHVSYAQEAEKRRQSIQVEALGASGLFGISYDTRFEGYEGFGIRAGLGFMPITTRRVGDNFNYDATGFTLPIEINFLLPFAGKQHFVECATGVNMGLYSLKGRDLYVINPSNQANPYEYKGKMPNKTVFGYNNIFNLGYRYQKTKGFSFRGGVTLNFNVGGTAYLAYPLMPYLGLGYSF